MENPKINEVTKESEGKQKELTEAFKVIQEELMIHSDIYEAFLGSIKSALEEKADKIRDHNVFIDTYEWSEHILKRIIGER